MQPNRNTQQLSTHAHKNNKITKWIEEKFERLFALKLLPGREKIVKRDEVVTRRFEAKQLKAFKEEANK